MKTENKSGKLKMLGAVISVVLVVAIGLGLTMAFFYDKSEEVVNQFTVGNVTTELVEDFKQTTPGDDTSYTKKPMVTNTGASDCLVRIRMNVTPESLLNQDVVNENGQATGQKYLVISGWNDAWVRKDDGFYYYNGVLKPGETTPPLFTTVDVNYDQYNPWVDFDIVMYQESVQAQIIKVDNTMETDAATIWAQYDRK